MLKNILVGKKVSSKIGRERKVFFSGFHWNFHSSLFFVLLFSLLVLVRVNKNTKRPTKWERERIKVAPGPGREEKEEGKSVCGWMRKGLRK